MRIISGSAKGTKLSTLAGQKTRPTSDRVKESLFNILGPSIQGAFFLDLFAGSGGIGLEALSRGASQVIWIENNPHSVSLILSNKKKARLNNGIVYTDDVPGALYRIAKKTPAFDFIFLDPPYGQGLVYNTLLTLDELSLQKTAGFIIAETSKKEEAPQVMSKLCLVRSRLYGNTALHFYQSKEELQ